MIPIPQGMFKNKIMTLKELINKGGKWLPLVGFGITLQSAVVTNMERKARIQKELEEYATKAKAIRDQYNELIVSQDAQNKLEASSCRAVEYFEDFKNYALSIDKNILNHQNITPEEQSQLMKNIHHSPLGLVENQKVTINSLNDELEIIIELMKNIKPKGSDVFGVLKDMLNTYQDYLLTLNLEQKIALTNLFSDIFIFACLVTIVTIFYGDLIIKYFNLEERLPKLAKLIQLRRKFQTYSLSLNIALIFAMLTCVVLFNLYIIFYINK